MINISEGGTMMTPKIRSERLLLRATAAQDYTVLRRHRSDPEIYRYIRPPEAEEKTMAVFEQLLLPWQFDEFRWNGLMICEASNPELCLGEMVFNVANSHCRHIEIGYLVDPSVSGKGYATEASRLLIDYLYDCCNWHKIIAHVDPRNVASVKILQKLGMVLEGQFKSHYRNGEQWNDEWCFGLLRKDWGLLRKDWGLLRKDWGLLRKDWNYQAKE